MRLKISYRKSDLLSWRWSDCEWVTHFLWLALNLATYTVLEMENFTKRNASQKYWNLYMIIRAHSFPRQNLTNSAVNFVNSAAHPGNTDEIPWLTAVTPVKFRSLTKWRIASKLHVMNLRILHCSLINHQSAISIEVIFWVVRMKNVKDRGEDETAVKGEIRGKIRLLGSARKNPNSAARLENPRSAENCGP